ncbi:transporter substrate-binding domain-containing protein [Roseococcus sp. YIM B11640]|uniref:transporter substrate-binding domain-containing protein n=1 Tax=Roseococcus sp. YIM B11640 TaxID=3133973 RepID=UPI003C7AD152
MRRSIAALGLAAALALPLSGPAMAQQARQQANAQAQRPAQGASTLDQVKARNQLVCGVNGQLPGFSAPDPQGVMRGFDADICRAIAAAVLGDANRVRFVNQATPEAGLTAVASRQIDLLVRNTTATMSRDSGRVVTAGPIIFYDGMGFLVPRSLGLSSPRALGGKTVCFAAEENAQGGAADNLSGFAQRHSVNWTTRRFDTQAQAVEALKAGTCHAFAADAGALSARRVTDFPDPDRWVVLPEIISGEPLVPWTRAGDEAWRDMVFWSVQALIQAEAFGVTSQNLPQSLGHSDWRVRRILGVESDLGRPFNLPNTWAARMIQAVGNYGEIFERNLGHGSAIGMDRGLNEQWSRGGLIYGIPMR